jgi:hypothetical protein
VNTCLPDYSVLSFWAYYDNGDNEDQNACSFQACIASTCTVFNAVPYTEASGNNGYQQYSMYGPTFAEPTTVEISVSANGGSEGECSGSTLTFDDFLLS